MKMGPAPDPRCDRRGDASTVGIVLLFGMVIMGATLVGVTGILALDAIEDRSVSETRLQSMEQLDADLTTLQYAGDGAVELEGKRVEADGNISFQLNPNAVGPDECRGSLPLGSIVDDGGSDTYVHQAGGTFRVSEGETTIDSTPDLRHERVEADDGTYWSIRFPMTSIEQADPTGGDRTAIYDESQSAALRDRLRSDLCMPISNHDEINYVGGIRIEVTDTAYADAWAAFLEDELPTERGDTFVRGPGVAGVPDDAVVAQAPLGPEADGPIPARIDAPDVLALGGLHTTDAEALEFTGSIDGYDSRVGPYSASAGDHGAVVSSGDLTVRRQGSNWDVVRGDAVAGGEIHLENGATVTGEERPNAVLPEPPVVTDHVEERISFVADEYNDNEETDAIDADGLEDGAQTLESGVYHFDSLEVDEELELDLADGDVVIAVDDDVTVDNHAAISVANADRGNQVRWFVGDDFSLREHATVEVAADRSIANWVYGTEDATVEIGNYAEFTGVGYAPGGHAALKEHATAYGALVVGAAENRQGDLHHDAAIEDFSLGNADEVDVDIGDGSLNVTDPSLESIDWQVSLVDAEYALISDSDRASMPVDDLPLETVDNPDDDLDSLEYWQTATSTADDERGGDRSTETFSGTTDCWFIECLGGYDDTQTFTGQAGDRVTVDVDPDHAELTLSRTGGPGGGSELATGTDELTAELPSNGQYEVEIETDDETDYSLEVATGLPTRTYDAFTFEATEHDEVALEVESDDVEPRFEVYDSDGAVVASASGSDTASETFRTDDGEYTVDVFAEGTTEFEYDVTLKRTHVHNGLMYREAPIRTSLLFDHDDGAPPETKHPWPDIDLDEHGTDTPYWEDTNVNHPAVSYPMTYETSVPANTSLSVEAEYFERGQRQSADDYAGTTRTDDDGDVWLERGLTDPRDRSTINALEDTESHRITILEDGDEVPEMEPVSPQNGVREMLGHKVREDADSTWRMNLEENEFAVVFELSPHGFDGCSDDDYDKSAPDWGWECATNTPGELPAYNDLVLLYEITGMEFADGGDGDEDEGEEWDIPDTEPDIGMADYEYAVQISNGVITVVG